MALIPRSPAQRNTAVSVCIILIASLFCMPGTAHAYIDPNTGGYAFQVLFPIISAIVGIYLFFKNQAVSLGRKVVGLFRKKTDDES